MKNKNQDNPTNQPPKNKPGQKVFSSDEKVQICKWIAWFKSPKEIQSLVKEEFGKTIDASTLSRSYFHNPQWQELIGQLRKDFLADISTVPISHKRVRLERLERIFQEALTPRIKSKNQFGTIVDVNLNAALIALKEAREETIGSAQDNALEGHEIEFLGCSDQSTNVPEGFRKYISGGDL